MRFTWSFRLPYLLEVSNEAIAPYHKKTILSYDCTLKLLAYFSLAKVHIFFVCCKQCGSSFTLMVRPKYVVEEEDVFSLERLLEAAHLTTCLPCGG